MLDNKIQGLSDKEVIDVLIARDQDHEARSVGVMYHILTCGENQDLFARMIRYINGGGVEYWHTILCNMNMAIFELWPFIHWPCKEQLMRLIREGVKQNVKQIENVVMSAFRTTMSSSEFTSKTRVLTYLSSIIREYEMWFKAQKSCSALVAAILNCVSHIIVSSPAPLSKEDTFRENMINFIHWVIKTRKGDCGALGRDFVLILIRLGRIPQIEGIWKELIQSPGNYGVSSLEDYLAKPNMLQQVRLSIELMRRIDFVVHHGGKNMPIYFTWLVQKFFRFNDGLGLRAECVRYLVNMQFEAGKASPNTFENRIQLLHLLVSTAPSGPDQQWLKLCLFIDWFGCDERNPVNLNNIELPLYVVRHALFLQAQPPHPNNLIQASQCSAFANSLLEFVCKSADHMLPVYSDIIKKNLNLAMKVSRDRITNGVAQILEHHKIDRRVSELIRLTWPDFVRVPVSRTASPVPVAPAPLPKLKKKSVDEKKQSPFATLETEESSVATGNVVKLEKENLRKEKQDKEENELISSIKLLKGDVKTKMEALKTQWKEFNDNADKCEAVEGVLNTMLSTDDTFDDAQQELSAQCLLGIMGSAVVDEKSLLSDGDGEEAFTHPIYSFLKMLCSPTSSDESSAEIMTNLMAAMREKDSRLTYVLLYFIKGAGVRPKEACESYREVARIMDRGVDEMLASDLQMCAVNDNRLFAYLVPFVFANFEEEVMQSPELLQTLCANADAMQLRSFISDIVREEIKIFRKDTFPKILMASVEWATTAQWVFWHLINADGVPIEWFLTSIPKLDPTKHDEAISNILLMMKRMDREPWNGLIRALFNRVPNRDDNFTADALKVLVEDTDQCHKVAELVAQTIKKLIGSNEIMGVGLRLQKKGTPVKLTLQQKKQRAVETFMARSHMQDAFASIKINDKCTVLLKKYSNLIGAMDIIAQDSKEMSSSRTLRGNRQGSNSGGDKQTLQQKRKASDTDDDQNNKKRKLHKDVIHSSDSDSD
ncbi:unnamed protein product [Caenorhabditis sp. 36 PRJEB53466]|nr:unnamed protein product [Caenorhabditis sp. 36 PRJEB53466]